VGGGGGGGGSTLASIPSCLPARGVSELPALAGLGRALRPARGAGGSLAEVEGLGDARHGDAEQQVVAQLGHLPGAHAVRWLGNRLGGVQGGREAAFSLRNLSVARAAAVHDRLAHVVQNLQAGRATPLGVGPRRADARDLAGGRVGSHVLGALECCVGPSDHEGERGVLGTDRPS